jgi:hypothetical protein
LDERAFAPIIDVFAGQLAAGSELAAGEERRI